MGYPTLRTIEPWIKELVRSHKLYVMRDKFGKAINVSYTKEGLKWTADKNSKLLYYKNARLEHRLIDNIYYPKFAGDLTPDPTMTVELFVPTDQYRGDQLFLPAQLAEIKMVDRAMRMLYHVPEYKIEKSNLVWTSLREELTEELSGEDEEVLIADLSSQLD